MVVIACITVNPRYYDIAISRDVEYPIGYI